MLRRLSTRAMLMISLALFAVTVAAGRMLLSRIAKSYQPAAQKVER